VPETSPQTGLDTGDAPTDPDLLIDMRGVSLRRSERTLVGPLDWAVELDERWVIIGPNGAGKTSLLRIAAATEHPSSGVAYVLGERLGRVDVSELRARIGLSSSALAQRVPDDEVVRDLVVSAGYAVLGRWRERYEDVDYQRATDMLESLGAEHLAERSYGTLSEGERKRVQIARALMTDPELLLLDEPAAGLNDRETAALVGLVRQLPGHGLTVCIIDHDMKLMRMLCRRLVVLDFGSKIADGPTEAVLADPTVLEVYLGGDL
jgi:iron complex transport system ATP-binding protein